MCHWRLASAEAGTRLADRSRQGCFSGFGGKSKTLARLSDDERSLWFDPHPKQLKCAGLVPIVPLYRVLHWQDASGTQLIRLPGASIHFRPTVAQILALLEAAIFATLLANTAAFCSCSRGLWSHRGQMLRLVRLRLSTRCQDGSRLTQGRLG